jgi:MFS family permease
VITYWFFVYLEKERGYASESILFTMLPAVLVLAAGYPIGGALGDWLFKRNPRGRVIISAIGVAMGAILLNLTIQVPIAQQGLFMVMLCTAAMFIPFAAPNVLSTLYDIVLPEVRSTANAISSFIETVGSALAPLIAGMIADATSLKDAILILCTSAWAVCFFFFMFVIFLVPKDIQLLHKQLSDRAETDRSAQPL